ncbi:hypothetical protein NZH93_47015 [Umezawaea endophytica]|uniref:Uncharacterized protein n=1 Tax=Umezawaea endophytica TaxID=1654476 RepID=A0A9X2VXD7_9PSEU|nr:hypothetical protein [Umezawaea endophytica]MCS7484430.1 hypothetical protein [Umezawaea endophytica]
MPECPTRVPPSQERPQGPSPHQSATSVGGTATCGVTIRSTEEAARIFAPVSAVPRLRKTAANRARSPALWHSVPPAGPIERVSDQCRSTRGSAPPTCPSACRLQIASSAVVAELTRPAGSSSRSRSTRSHGNPVTCSTSLPEMVVEALE